METDEETWGSGGPQGPRLSSPLSILQVLEKGSFTTGSVVQMFELARGLARRGHRVGVVSRPGGEVAARCAAEGLPFFPLPLAHELDLASARRLARIFEDRKAEIVHVHKGIAHSAALFATFFARAPRPRIVVNRGVSFPLDAFSGLKYRVRTDAVVTVSDHIKKIVVRSAGVRASKVHVVYAGVDLERFDPERAEGGRVRAEWGITPREKLLLQVGARDWKGWRDLVGAAALIKDAVPELVTAIVACKDAAEEERVRAFAQDCGVDDRVRAVGFRSDMPDVLSAADVVADLSYEGLGVTGTIREAMALGKPVVASSAGGNPELVEDGRSGLLVPPRNPEATAAAVRRILADAPLAERLGAAARVRVAAGFSTEVRLDRIELLYRGLVANAGTARRAARGEATIRDR